jgi:2-succinyl-6-hydroxy-2,4-cyclohexadiene-1-carboxylate synthase
VRLKVGDVALNVERGGRGPALLILHGFTGSVATWRPHRATLEHRCDMIAVDLLGHGESDRPADPERYRVERCTADLLVLLDRLGVDRFGVLGYSMGARVALHLAVAAPDQVGALILESGSPGMADPADRAARVKADAALADRIEREGVPAFVDGWERLPLFASQAGLSAQARDSLRAQRLRNDPRGLANSLRAMGAGQPEPLWDRLNALTIPTLLIVGALDLKYCDLARQMASLLMSARLEAVPDVGHAVHLERPDAFDAAVARFFGEWE